MTTNLFIKPIFKVLLHTIIEGFRVDEDRRTINHHGTSVKANQIAPISSSFLDNKM